ncbi:hypothetical protein [Acetilactobacillus jinshanensis]|uniref:Uncharacterized protein n=1 Tax=Acetilactobacillus jinshanensis TaxID=1720083 RepID=A0A4P6ZKS0_9LACO|nr:hypothetical protein [Acetilactobacillus jinshanensis]QBP18391.1 hypothetical protein ELX58_04405 [Acetilactobacillus jinshanensis]URL61261.1 hypothetical protein HGK75_04500 [uncultured bacterium]
MKSSEVLNKYVDSRKPKNKWVLNVSQVLYKFFKRNPHMAVTHDKLNVHYLTVRNAKKYVTNQYKHGDNLGTLSTYMAYLKKLNKKFMVSVFYKPKSTGNASTDEADDSINNPDTPGWKIMLPNPIKLLERVDKNNHSKASELQAQLSNAL